MRSLGRPVTVHTDHVSAVLDVDYSPTGKEFVSASFDKTIRIFPKDGGHSRFVFTRSFLSQMYFPSSCPCSFSIFYVLLLDWQLLFKYCGN